MLSVIIDHMSFSGEVSQTGDFTFLINYGYQKGHQPYSIIIEFHPFGLGSDIDDFGSYNIIIDDGSSSIIGGFNNFTNKVNYFYTMRNIFPDELPDDQPNR